MARFSKNLSQKGLRRNRHIRPEVFCAKPPFPSTAYALMCAWRPSLPVESGLKTRSRARPDLGAVRGTRTRRALFLCPVVRERMPKRTDIKSILIIGAGPIVIGQACEFDYSGTQACKALKEEGYRIVLVNSNPATIMTDPDLADATYVEPITPEIVAKI